MARLHTKSKAEGYDIVKYINEHNHAAAKSQIGAKIALYDLKANSKTSDLSTRPLITKCLSSLDNHGKCHVTSIDHLSRNVRKWRQKELKFPHIPKTRTGFAVLHFECVKFQLTFSVSVCLFQLFYFIDFELLCS